MKLTEEEKVFLMHVLGTRVNHPNKLGWVHPVNKEFVFEHHQMVTLLNKVICEG